MGLVTKLHFSRFEFKYILGHRLRGEIEQEINYFMGLDPYVAKKPMQKYMVRSLYFDNSMFTHYHEKIDGLKTRSKFRLRTYTDDPAEGCAAFLEIKGRHNNLVFKHRAPLSWDPGSGFTLNDNNMVGKIKKFTQKSDVLDRFHFDLIRRRIKPVMLIDYQRRPYVSKFDSAFRVTFDECLEGRATPSLYPGESTMKRSILLGCTVMEVKFRHHVPSWFHRIIQSYELQRVSISKICKGIEVFGLAPHLE